MEEVKSNKLPEHAGLSVSYTSDRDTVVQFYQSDVNVKQLVRPQHSQCTYLFA